MLIVKSHLVLQQGGAMRKFAGMGTCHPDPTNPDLKASTKSWKFRMHEGRVRAQYKQFMHETMWRPSGQDGPLEGWRVFNDDFDGASPPVLVPQTMFVMQSLPEVFRHLEVSGSLPT